MEFAPSALEAHPREHDAETVYAHARVVASGGARRRLVPRERRASDADDDDARGTASWTMATTTRAIVASVSASVSARAREPLFAGHSETGRQRCGSEQRSVSISRSTCVNTDAKPMQQQNDFLLATCKTLESSHEPSGPSRALNVTRVRRGDV